MSVPFRAGEATQWCGGNLLRGRPDAVFAGASIDSRSVESGQLFVAIVGPNYDGHDYLVAAAERGAAGLVVGRDRQLPAALASDLPVISVEDTTLGLGAIAAGHRRGYRGPLIAITGSNGKTTTKEMCAAILSVAQPCLKNRGNLNNQFGLPVTLLSRAETDQRIVVELGTNHRGEIAALAEIAAPTVAVVTNIGTAHIEHLGSQDEIAREKGDLLASLPRDGSAVVNADDPYAADLARRTKARVLRFGGGRDADVGSEDASVRDGHGFAFGLRSPEGRVDVEVAGLGATTVANALAAAAAALAAGVSLGDVVQGLAKYRPIGGRLERRELPGDVTVVDDSYNANPQSLEVALRLLADSPVAGRRLAVLGDMGELGDASESAHREAGRLVATLGIDLLFAVGARAETVAAGAAEAGMNASQIQQLRDSNEAGAPVKAALREGDWVLVKGSRSMRMERVTKFLDEEARS